MKKIILFSILSCYITSAKTQVINIVSLGAVGDGKFSNTKMIQYALDSCNLSGGGKVYIPAGIFLCGEINVKANTTLYLDNGAVLLASDKMNDYPGGHFITADKADNFSIEGKGKIDGQGHKFYDAHFAPLQRPVPWIMIKNSRHISIKDVQLMNSPSHVLVLELCDDITIDGITIINPKQSPNTDGIDITLSKNVRISNCYIDTGDDAICLKASYGKSGDGMPVIENIVVTNCVLSSDDAALKLGTGSFTAIRYCSFSNCIIRNTRYGIALFMQEGGVFENIEFNNIQIQTGSIHGDDYPVMIDIHRKNEKFIPGSINNIHFTNIDIVTDGKILVSGHPQQPVSNIFFKQITMKVKSPVDVRRWQKPKGNKTVKMWDDCADYASDNSCFTIAHASNIFIDGLLLQYDVNAVQNRDGISIIKSLKTEIKNFTAEGIKGKTIRRID